MAREKITLVYYQEKRKCEESRKYHCTKPPRITISFCSSEIIIHQQK